VACVPRRHVCILRPSEAEHKCKYYHVWTIDSLARCMLAISQRVLHWLTHSCLRKYSQFSAPDVGMSFAYAISVPTLVASRVGMSCAIAISVPMLVASCVGTSFALARSMPTLGCLKF